MLFASDPVLVLDANGQAGLSVIRSLGRRGVSVTAGSDTRASLGRLSRFSDAAYTHPDSGDDEEEFITHLRSFLEATDHFAVIPVLDQTSVILSRHKTELEDTGTVVAVEDWETFLRTYDKGQLFELGESLEVPTPATFAPRSVNEVDRLSSELPYPAVVKPRSKTVWDDAGTCHYTTIDETHYVRSPAELVETYRGLLDQFPVLEERDHYPLVQEYIEGTTTTTVVLADDGEILTHFQEERVRTYPSSGGNSTLLRGLNDPGMLAYAREVVDDLEWTGPAMVEFMRTPDGEYYLIEVNGRYWGSLPFAIESGVDFPWLHYRQLCGKGVKPPMGYRTDVLHQRLLCGDLKWLGERIRRDNPTAVVSFIWACLFASQTFVSFEDPVPTFWALGQVFEMGVRSLLDHLQSNHHTDMVSSERYR